eukprot:Nitzschia sp. Nitz4//scaffold79_size90958//32831//33757//NITZ4_005019-RA/size90958-processed-gene-0.110-mRNA-1//-1//CDS//3329558231//825//frame0
MVLDITLQASEPITVLERIVGDQEGSPASELSLLFLGCEAKPPYGPYDHTASLFLDLITQALVSSGAPKTKVAIHVYGTSSGHFPTSQAFEQCNGVIVGGSFNSAYDSEEWIDKLADVIQKELVAKQRPTMGICFGHQIYAHSFPEGRVAKTPTGPQAGRRVSELTSVGHQWLRSNSSEIVPGEEEDAGLHLFCSHGDMVHSLPKQGHALGGTKEVPIQSVIYFSDHDAQKPIAVTFQAHPEYASSKDMGLEMTLQRTMHEMRERGDIPEAEFLQAQKDAVENFTKVQQHSIETMVTVGQLLGWFPKV